MPLCCFYLLKVCSLNLKTMNDLINLPVVISIVISLYGVKMSPFKPPNIILLMGDDLGWNDVSFHGSCEIPTPNIDALAGDGIILNNYYVQPVCTPSRAALHTGKYPIRLGLQHDVIGTGQKKALPLREKTLPQYLKKLGYSTHLVGKWHLGNYKTEHTPIHRGFDSFFGYWNGYIDYFDYTHINKADNVTGQRFWGIDLHENDKVVRNFRGYYSTEVFADKAMQVIENHNPNKPLFLHFSPQAVHVGNEFSRFQAPYKYMEKFPWISNVNRKVFAGMLTALDDSVGRVFEMLYRKKMLDNTIVIFTTDNGGEDLNERIGSNFPLRGKKSSVWEGGIRGVGAIWSPLLGNSSRRVAEQMMHITDWLPTLYDAAGGDVRQLGKIDGFSQWTSLRKDLPSPRREILHNIDQIDQTAALRVEDYKIVVGVNNSDGWHDSNNVETPSVSDMDKWMWKQKSRVGKVLSKIGRKISPPPDDWQGTAIVKCPRPPPGGGNCDLSINPCLFNIKEDPCEHYDLYDEFPQIASLLLSKLKGYNKMSMEPVHPPIDPRSNPIRYGFAYISWLDEDIISTNFSCPEDCLEKIHHRKVKKGMWSYDLNSRF